MRIEIILENEMEYNYEFSNSWYPIQMLNYRNNRTYKSLILANLEEELLSNNDLLQFINRIKSLDKNSVKKIILFNDKVYSYQIETYKISEIFSLEKEQMVFNSSDNLLTFYNIEFEYIKNDPHNIMLQNGLFILFNFIDTIGENDEINTDIN